MKAKIIKLLKNPILWVILLTAAAAAVIFAFTVTNRHSDNNIDSLPVIATATTEATTSTTTGSTTTSAATTSAATATSSATTSSATTSSTVMTASTTEAITYSAVTHPATSPIQPPVYTAAPPTTPPAVVTTAAPPPPPPTTTMPPSPYTQVGESPNSSFYQQRLFIVGDSIANGFGAYGFIPKEHNLAKGSLSMANYTWSQFLYYTPAGQTDFIGAVAYYQPQLLYMSLGMNDVNWNPVDKWVNTYRNAINSMLAKVPNMNIVVGAITPIDYNGTFTSNAKIRQYNEALKTMVEGLGSPRVHYFDAYSVVADPATLALKSGNSSGDGIHLSPNCYKQVLNAMFNFMDTISMREQIG